MKEIILLGTLHFYDKLDIFSADMQGQLERFAEKLSAIAPTKIAVEFPAVQQDILDNFYSLFSKTRLCEHISFGHCERYGKDTEFTSVNEIVQVGFRLASLLEHKRVYGADEDIELPDDLAEKCLPYVKDKLDRLWEYYNKTLAETDGSIPDMYRIHNSPEYISLDHGIYMALNKLNFGGYEGSDIVAKWYERNLKIFSNLQNICEDGDRLLLLIGSAHIKILQELADSDPELSLIQYQPCNPQRYL